MSSREEPFVIPIRNPYSIGATYQGVRFRSRLEARWAAFFDLIGWRWFYEPTWGGRPMQDWLPDFAWHAGRNLLEDDHGVAEVKFFERLDQFDLARYFQAIRAWSVDSEISHLTPILFLGSWPLHVWRGLVGPPSNENGSYYGEFFEEFVEAIEPVRFAKQDFQLRSLWMEAGKRISFRNGPVVSIIR